MIVQFGSGQFSPRFLRWFRSEPTLKHALGTFVATFLFALTATAMTGRGIEAAVPYRSLVLALVLALASVGWFLALVSRSSNYLRVAQVTRRVDANARQVFDSVYPQTHSQVKAASAAVLAIDESEPVQVFRHEGVGAILQSIDRRALLRLAIAHDATIEMVRSVGDYVPTDAVVVRSYGDKPIAEWRLRAGLFFGDERTVEDDPAFSFRLLVDVAIKALSPAVNDPTTAVQCLDRIEGVLRCASAKHLSVGVVLDDTSAVRLIYPTPSWNDLVTLALDEIRAFGASQYQISRRMRALNADLLADLPPERHAALERQLALLDIAVRRGFPDDDLRADALVPDRQGLGPSHGFALRLGEGSDPVGSSRGLG